MPIHANYCTIGLQKQVNFIFHSGCGLYSALVSAGEIVADIKIIQADCA